MVREFLTALREQALEWLQWYREQAKARPPGESREGMKGLDGVRGDGFSAVYWAIPAPVIAVLPVVMFVVGQWVLALILLAPVAAFVALLVMLTIRAVREGHYF